MQVPGFLAGKFRVWFEYLCTTSELLIRQTVRPLTIFHIVVQFTRDSRTFSLFSPQPFCEIITKPLWLMKTVSSRFWAVPARSSGESSGACKLHKSDLWENVSEHCASQLACLCLVSWTFLQKKRISVDSSSELTIISSGVFLWFNNKLCHHDIV